MPVTVRKARKGRGWNIVEKSSGRVVGKSKTKKFAHISASYRNRAIKKKASR